jgi:hypothetical protein
LADFLRLHALVLDVEVQEDFTADVLTFQDLGRCSQNRAGTGSGRFDFRGVDCHKVPIRRNCTGAAFVWLNIVCIEINDCHDVLSICVVGLLKSARPQCGY